MLTESIRVLARILPLALPQYILFLSNWHLPLLFRPLLLLFPLLSLVKIIIIIKIIKIIKIIIVIVKLITTFV